MKRDGSDRDPELEAFLQPRKIQRQMPAALRARVLARARATLAGEVIAPAWPPDPAERVAMPFARGRRVVRIALAASIAVAAGAVGAVAALQGRSARTPEVTARPSPPPHRGPGGAVDRPSSDPVIPPAEPAAAAPAPRPAHPGNKSDRFTAELDLLQRAHAAYTRRDFPAALALVAEHARRFPKGHLAEQREALRVRSLAGAGRADEAHRAAAAFAVRFPRSVLLPLVDAGAESSAR